VTPWLLLVSLSTTLRVSRFFSRALDLNITLSLPQLVPGLTLSPLMSYTAFFLLMRCAWNSRFQLLTSNKQWQIFPLGLPWLGAEVLVVVVADHITVAVVVHSTTIVDEALIFLRMLHPLPAQHARFVASLDTQLFAVIRGRSPLPSLILHSLPLRLITRLRCCLLRTHGTLIQGPLIILPTTSRISICHMRNTLDRIKSM
jgi:hypothetical protein